MEKSLENWLNYIQTLRPIEKDFSLARVRHIYKDLVNTSLAKKVVVVGGTNGKGTTVEFLNNLALTKGLKVGSYTSPHLFKFNERIRINGEPIGDDQIVNAFESIEEIRGEQKLTYFDFATLAALKIFSKSKLDLVILEIGIGGRFDPVNIVNPDISILTSVDLDHENWLGETKEKIGKEKAAIFRKNKPAILGQLRLPSSVLTEAEAIGAEVIHIGKEFNAIDHRNGTWSYNFNRSQKDSNEFKKNNLSIESAACALTAFILLGYDLNHSSIEAINSTQLEGRCDLVDGKFLLDVSHNQASAKQLSNYLESNYKNNRKISAIFGVMQDKNVKEIISEIKPHVSKWRITSPRIERAMTTKELSNILTKMAVREVYTSSSVKESIREALAESDDDELIVVFGSFYMVSEALEEIHNLRI